MEKVRLHLIIEGLVQGVWFRDSTRKKARSLGVSGWVRNRPDGTVEVLAEGPEKDVAAFVSWCHHGPPSAEVARVRETRQGWQGEFTSFDIIF